MYKYMTLSSDNSFSFSNFPIHLRFSNHHTRTPNTNTNTNTKQQDLVLLFIMTKGSSSSQSTSSGSSSGSSSGGYTVTNSGTNSQVLMLNIPFDYECGHFNSLTTGQSLLLPRLWLQRLQLQLVPLLQLGWLVLLQQS